MSFRDRRPEVGTKEIEGRDQDAEIESLVRAREKIRKIAIIEESGQDC